MIFFELFSHNPTLIHTPAGRPLFSEGDDGHLMYVLTTGTAEILVNNRVVETLQHGSIVGEIGMVLQGPRSATVVALTDCEFVVIDEQRFQFLVQQTPYFAMQVMRVLAERLRKINQMVTPIEDI